jgi:hypothetical protein
MGKWLRGRCSAHFVVNIQPSFPVKKSSSLPANLMVLLKLTPLEQNDFVAAFVKHLKVLKVVALSGRIFASGS